MIIIYLWFFSYFYPLLLIAKLIFQFFFFEKYLFIDCSIKINNWNECVILFDIYSDYYKLIILPENPLNNNHLLLEWI